MNTPNKKKLAYVIFALIAIGILSKISSNLLAYMIPIAVFGIVFYFYKFPPNRPRTRKMTSSRKDAAKKSKAAKFRVIEGSRSDKDDETPPYH